MILDLMAASGSPLSRLVARFPGSAWSRTSIRSPRPAPAVQVPMSSLWERIAAAFPDARADRRDGLRLEWDDRWVHVRASNTEPIVRVIAEAPEAEDARELSSRIGEWVARA